MYKDVVIYEWPNSQECIDCKHAEFVESQTFNNSNYICKIKFKNNDGIYCPNKYDIGDFLITSIINLNDELMRKMVDYDKNIT